MYLFDDLKCQNIDHRQRYIDEICLYKNCTQPRMLCRYCKISHQQHDDKIITLDDLEELIKKGKPLEEIQEIQEIKKLVGFQIKDAKILLDNIQLAILEQFQQFDNPIQIANNQEAINIEQLNNLCSQLIPIVCVQNKKVQFQVNETLIYRLKDNCFQELDKMNQNLRQTLQNIRLMEQTQTQVQFNFKKIDIQNIEYKGNVVRLKQNLVYSQMILIEPELEQVKVNNIAEVRFKILQNDKFCSFGVTTSDQQNLMSSSRSLMQSSIFTGNSKVQYMINSNGEIISSNENYNKKNIGFQLEKNDIVTIRLNYQENLIEFQKNHGISTKLKNIIIVDNLFGALALKEIGDSVEIL